MRHNDVIGRRTAATFSRSAFTARYELIAQSTIMHARRLPMYFPTPLSLPDQRPISQRSTVGVGKHTDSVGKHTDTSNFLIKQRQRMIHSPIASGRPFVWERDKLERRHKNLIKTSHIFF